MRTLNDFLNEKGCVSRGQNVATTLIKEMQVYGFIPLCESKYFDFLFDSKFDFEPELGKIAVYGNRAIQIMKNATYRYPVFERVLLCDKDVVPLEHLYVPQYIDYETQFRCSYKDYLRRTAKVIKPKYSQIETDENGNYNYKIKGDEFFFSSDKSVLNAVASKFLVVCMRINTVSGELVYEVYEPQDLVPLI